MLKRASVQEIICNPRLDFLSCTPYEDPAPGNLPSGIPDCSLPADRAPFLDFRLDFKAGDNFRSEVELSTDGEILVIKGKCLGRITRISRLEGSEPQGPGISELEPFCEAFGSFMIMNLQLRLDWLDECLSISYEEHYLLAV